MTDEITFIQDIYCGILDHIMKVKTAGKFDAVPQKKCRDMFYEVDHGLMSVKEFEKQMRMTYSPTVIESMSGLFAQIINGKDNEEEEDDSDDHARNKWPY